MSHVSKMDALSVAAIIAAVGGLAVAVFTHIKHSNCYGMTIDTYEPSPPAPTPAPTPAPSPKETHV